jgi:hypothetical protein
MLVLEASCIGGVCVCEYYTSWLPSISHLCPYHIQENTIDKCLLSFHIWFASLNNTINANINISINTRITIYHYENYSSWRCPWLPL